jgi:hypothetical protein
MSNTVITHKSLKSYAVRQTAPAASVISTYNTQKHGAYVHSDTIQAQLATAYSGIETYLGRIAFSSVPQILSSNHSSRAVEIGVQVGRITC